VSIRRRFLASIALCAWLAAPVLADTRKDNIDVVIALDKSLSMEHKIVAVKEWVNSFIIDQLLIKGDNLVVIAFYGKSDLLISQAIKGDEDKPALKKIISQIRGNGRFTDIGNALDVLKAQIAAHENDGRQKYVLLLTDGIQEAPPSSKYWSKDGSFNHEFLTNTKTILQKGWKVMILGIGTDTAAKDLARELQGSYTEITNKLTVDQLTEKTGALFGAVTVAGPVRVGGVAADGASRLGLTLKATGLQGDATITVSGISAKMGAREIANILVQPFTVTVKKDASASATVPLRFPTDLPQGTQPAALLFSFSSAQKFSPADAAVSVTVNGWIQNNIPLLIGAIVVLLALVALIWFLLWRLTRGKPLRFAVLIDDEPVGDTVTTLSGSREIFLNETSGDFSFMQRRNARSLARFSVKDGRLLLTVLKQDRFPKVKEVPPEARGKTFPMKAENGKSLTMKVQAKERKK
jgi:Mg-chelatase subunit ChlD